MPEKDDPSVAPELMPFHAVIVKFVESSIGRNSAVSIAVSEAPDGARVGNKLIARCVLVKDEAIVPRISTRL
jgi:hypothetical protein